jgi:hypothetical protein
MMSEVTEHDGLNLSKDWVLVGCDAVSWVRGSRCVFKDHNTLIFKVKQSVNCICVMHKVMSDPFCESSLNIEKTGIASFKKSCGMFTGKHKQAR